MGRGPNRPGTSGRRFTQERKATYLAALRRSGLKSVACWEANVSRCTIWKHRRRYPEFAQAEEDALTAYRQTIENEVNRRAIEGVERPVFLGGKQVGSIREYSDRMLIELARRHIPEYRPSFKFDQRTTHAGAVAAAGLADLSKLSPEGRDLLRQLLEIGSTCRLKIADERPWA